MTSDTMMLRIMVDLFCSTKYGVDHPCEDRTVDTDTKSLKRPERYTNF